jgi:hypothetical protein
MSRDRDDLDTLILHGDAPDAVPPAEAARTLITLPWRDSPLPEDPWLAHLLPRLDYNSVLLQRVGARPPPPGCGVSLFLADPLINLERTFERLLALGVAWIAAFPSITRFDDEFARVLSHGGLTADSEGRGLARARDAGFAIAAARWHARDPRPAGAACLITPQTAAEWTGEHDCPIYIYPVSSGATQRCRLFRAPVGDV